MKHCFSLIFVLSFFWSFSANSQNETVTVIDTAIGDNNVRVPVKDGEWHGIAIYHDKETGVKVAELTYDMGKKTGPATHYDDETGCKYCFGVYVDNAKVGDWTYLHDCSDNVQWIVRYEVSSDTGRATAYYASGNIYREGEMKDNKLDGVWKQYYDAPGRVSKISNQCFSQDNGEAVFYDSATQNITAKGSYKCNKKSGLWEHFDAETSVLTSSEEYNEKGELDGEFFEYFFSGRVKEHGYYRNDLRQGVFRTYDSATGNVTGEHSFTNDTLNGKVIKYYPSGKLMMDGSYMMGITVGFWRGFYEDGNTQYTAEHEKLTGVALLKYYAPGGELTYSGRLKEGGKEGKWAFYDEGGKGILMRVEDYKDGLLDGTSVFYYPDKKIKSKGSHKHGLADGKWKRYYPSGKLWVSMEYKHGNFDGKLKSYYENGKLRRKEEYDNGKLLSSVCYSEAGTEMVYTDIANPAHYDGDLDEYYRDNMVHPQIPFPDDEEGIVIVSIHVDDNGKVTVKGVNSNLPDEYDKEAVRLVNEMKNWKPGTLDGFPVAGFTEITVPFSRVE